MKPDEAQRLQNFLYQRLYETALNNVGYKCNAEDVYMDIADNRLKTWLYDFYSQEREEAIKLLENVTIYQEPDSNYRKALDIAIKALEQIEKIKQIIAVDNSVIQEDVLKYKMICEVIKV